MCIAYMCMLPIFFGSSTHDQPKWTLYKCCLFLSKLKLLVMFKRHKIVDYLEIRRPPVRTHLIFMYASCVTGFFLNF